MPSRRNILINSVGMAAVIGLPSAVVAAESTQTNKAAMHAGAKGKHAMNTITTQDGTQIFYNDGGTGRPVVFSHGWPLAFIKS